MTFVEPLVVVYDHSRQLLQSCEFYKFFRHLDAIRIVVKLMYLVQTCQLPSQFRSGPLEQCGFTEVAGRDGTAAERACTVLVFVEALDAQEAECVGTFQLDGVHWRVLLGW
jgi:hypothetical protein